MIATEHQPRALPLYIRPGGGLEGSLLFLTALVTTLVIFGFCVLALGHGPIAIYQTLYLGGFGTWFSIQDTLIQAAPIMLTGLCTALPARAGILVIGNEGALIIGGIAAVLAGVVLEGLSPWFGVPLVAVAAATAGGLWIGAAGALRHYRGVNEVISTLLMNYIAIAILLHLVSGPIRDYSRSLRQSSWSVPEEFMLGSIPGTMVHGGLAIGVVVCLIAFLLTRYSTFGFATDIMGGNVRAARAVGLPIGRITLTACFLGGGAAGLAGGIEIIAVHGYASDSLIVGYGYAGILVAFAARFNPLAVILIAILIGGVSAAGGLVERRFGLPDAMTLVFQGILFLAVLGSNTLVGQLGPWLNKKVLGHAD